MPCRGSVLEVLKVLASEVESVGIGLVVVEEGDIVEGAELEIVDGTDADPADGG